MPIIVNPRFQAFDDNGAPLAGGKAYFYENNTTTAKDVYTDAALTNVITQPVELDPDGTALIFGSGTYSVKLTDSADVQEWNHDDIIGIESGATQSQWVLSSLTPTYATATTFTLEGDQTTEFHPGRAIKCVVTGLTLYEHITDSSYSSNTTVTITNSSGSLNAGLSSVSLGLITFDDTARPYIGSLDAAGAATDIDVVITPKGSGAIDVSSGAFNENKGTDVASATTTDIGAATGNYINVTGTTTITSLGTIKEGVRRLVRFSGSLTLTHSSNIYLPFEADVVTATEDIAEFVSLGSGSWICTQYHRRGAVTGYIAGRTEYLEWDVGAASTAFDIDAVIGAAWESVGPTSSGATNTWTALDDIPPGAKWVKIKLISSAAVAAATVYLHVYGRKTGSAVGLSYRTMIAYDKVNATGATAAGIDSKNTATIPIDENRRFDLYLDVTGGATVVSEMYLVGWGM